jgi:hypothetical protein
MTGKRCRAQGCTARPTFGYRKPRFCQHHKLDDMREYKLILLSGNLKVPKRNTTL